MSTQMADPHQDMIPFQRGLCAGILQLLVHVGYSFPRELDRNSGGRARITRAGKTQRSSADQFSSAKRTSFSRMLIFELSPATSTPFVSV